MSVSCQSNESERRLVATFKGPFDYESIVRQIKRRLAQKTFGFDTLIIATETTLNLTTDEVHRLVDYLDSAVKKAMPGRTSLRFRKTFTM